MIKSSPGKVVGGKKNPFFLFVDAFPPSFGQTRKAQLTANSCIVSDVVYYVVLEVV